MLLKENKVYKVAVAKYNMADKKNRVVMFLMLVVIILLGIIVYILVVQPRFQGYVVQQQVSAQKTVIATIIQSLNQNGYVQVTDSNGTTITLVPYQGQAQQAGQPQR